MTATTSARSRNPVKASENRDTSPSAAISQQRSNSSEEEPFDQHPSNNKGTMRPYNDDEVDEVLGDGELPSLTLKPANGRIVNGQRTTTRPLSPPSKAGVTSTLKQGPAKEQQRQFWGQLDADPEERERPSYEEDGPDDEMAARQVTRRNETGRRFKDVDADMDMDESAMSRNYTFSTAGSMEEQEANFCGQTLTALGEICGTGIGYKPSDTPPKRIQNRPLNKPLPQIRSKKVEVPTLEEHTAIEVEFVEPNAAEAISPQRKNAYLTAMAKKAKDDFQKKKDESKLGEADPEAPREDIYNNFSAAEKRMFLKFINTGVSPSDASQRIIEERKPKEQKEKERLEEVETEAEAETAVSLGRKNNFRGLAFWKKDKDGSTKSPRSKSTPPSKSENVVKEAAPETTESAKATTTDAAANGSKERPSREEKRPSPTKAAAVVRSLSPESSTPVSKTKASPSPAAAWSVSPRPSPPAQAQNSPAAAAKPLTPAKNGKATLVVTTSDFSPPEPELELESHSDDGEYPKSGINYYDAVRRGHRDDEAEQFDEPDSPKNGNNSSRAAPGRNSTARAMKFSALRESRAKSAPRGRESDDQQAPVRPPRSAPARGDNGKQPESSFSSTPPTKADSLQRNAAPENGSMSLPYSTSVPYVKEQPKSSPRTVKALMKPETRDVNKNATSREEDSAALERIEQELLRPHKPSAASISDSPGPVQPLPANKRDQRPKGVQTKPSSTVESSQGDRTPFSNALESSNDSGHAIRSASISTIDGPQDSAPATARALSTPNPDYESVPNVSHALNSQVEPASRPKEDQHVEVQGMDVDIDVDAYLNSTDTYSVVSRDNDAMSVYTAGTGITQSSRVRRPGAAQARLAKAKQADQVTKKGWHESIRAAAVSTNRVWDPKRGWVDYEEPDDHALDSSNDKIHFDLDKNALRRPKKNEGDSHLANAGGTSVPVPFPKEWERERDEMLRPVMENVAQSPVAPETQMASVGELNNVSMQSGASASKPKGWVESMRAASEALGQDGQKWDPDHGWMSADQGASQTPDVVDFDAPDVVDFNAPVTQPTSQLSSQPALPPVTHAAEPSYNSHTERVSNAVYLEPPPVAKASVPTDPDAYYGSADESIFREPRALAIPLPPRDTDRKLNQWMEKSENAPKNRSELSTESSDKAVASAGTGAPTEKYMQLGDTGSVRSQYQDVKSSGQPPRPIGGPDTKSSGQPPRPSGGPSVQIPVVTPRIETHETNEPSESEDDEAPLLQSSGSFPSTTDFSPTVGIVREKVSQEDMGWFPQDTSPTVGIVREKMSQEDMVFFPEETRERRQIHPAKAAASQGTASSGSVSQSPSRRGAGPVDLDEVDETWESDDEKRQSDGWEANSYPMIAMTKSEESLYTGSQSSLPMKPVPKLRSSRKDTSPIRGRKSKSSEAPAVMRGDSAPARGTGNVDQNKALSPSSREGNAFDSTGRTREAASLTSAPKPSNSPGVKARLEEWESRAVDAVSPTEEEKNSGANAEWKSFLGKKVRAESAAAARQQGASGAREEFKEDLKQTKEPEGDRWNRKTHTDSAASFVSAGGGRHAVETQEEDDSLFEFVSNPGNPVGDRSARVSREREREPKRPTSLERSELSPIRAQSDDSDSDDDPVSEAYGPEANERMSFLKRLTECAAPMMPSSARTPTNSDAMPSAHLAFLRTNPQGSGSKQGPSRFVPPGLCGRPDIIDEDEDADESIRTNETEERRKSGQNQSQLTESSEKPRSRSTPRGGSRAGVSTSSVISDDVGSKTAYFEAIAMKAAVSNPRRSESRRRDRSSGASSVTSGSSQHSEKWKAFLDRKNASGASPLKSRASSSTETSKAAEKYAAGKVEEMMAKMANRSKVPSNTAREPDASMDWPSVNTSGPSINTSGESYGGEQSNTNKSDSVSKAAEDLAAARVEAMMAALSSSHLDEGEI